MQAASEFKIGPLAIRVLVEGAESGGSVATFECDVPAGAKVPAPHSHDDYEETIYGLRGVMTWTVEGTATDIGLGDVVCIPRGAVHKFENDGSDDASVLVIVTPGILGPDYFPEVAAVIEVRPDQTVTLDELDAHTRLHIAGYKVPLEVQYLDKIEPSPSGKPDYRCAKSVATGAQ